jgi:2-polyprenyl-3-methyl-5-hydroxy-6-metoxy-1,4-benzoquinol methylase
LRAAERAPCILSAQCRDGRRAQIFDLFFSSRAIEMKKLQDRVDIVAGSGRAIGQALALNLARKGARVMVNDLDTAPAASK